jgi:hypothetical protein
MVSVNILKVNVGVMWSLVESEQKWRVKKGVSNVMRGKGWIFRGR